MKDSKNVTILLLTISAVLLGSLLLALNHTTPANAAMGQRLKPYIQVTGQYNSSMDLLYVVDLGVQKLNVYYTNPDKKTTVLLTTLDLKKAFQD